MDSIFSPLFIVLLVMMIVLSCFSDILEKHRTKRFNLDLFEEWCEEDPTLSKKAFIAYLGEEQRLFCAFDGLNGVEMRFKSILTKRMTFLDYINEVMNKSRKNLKKGDENS